MSWWSPSLETPKQQVSGDIMEFIRQKQGSKMQDSKRIRLDAHSIKALPSTPKVQIMRDSGLVHCGESDDSDPELSGCAGERFPGETIFNSLSSTDLNLFKFTPKLCKSGELFRSATNEESPTGNLAAVKVMATPSFRNFTVSTENNSPLNTKYCDLEIDSPIVENYFKARLQSNHDLGRYKEGKEPSLTSDQSNATNRQDISGTSLPFPPLRRSIKSATTQEPLDPPTGSETASLGSVSNVIDKVVALRQFQNSNQLMDSSTVCSNNLKEVANQEPSTDFSSPAKVLPAKVPEFLNSNTGYNEEKASIPPRNAIFHSSPVKEDFRANQGPKGIESSPILISCSALLKYNAFSAENELNEEDFELLEKMEKSDQADKVSSPLMSECSEIFPCSIPTQAMADLPLDGFAHGSTQCEFYDADFATQLLANIPMTQYSRKTTEFQTAGQKAITVGDGIQQLGQAFQREQDIEFQGIPIATTILRNEVTIPKAHRLFRPIILGDPTNLTFGTQMKASVLTTKRTDDKNYDIGCELSQPVVSNPPEMEVNLGNENNEQLNPKTDQELIKISEPQEESENCKKESFKSPFNNPIDTLPAVSGFRTAAGNSIPAPTSAAIKEWTSKLVQASSIEEKDHIEKTDSSVDGPSFSTIPVTVDTITQGQPVSLQEQVTHPNVGGSNLADSQPSGFRTASGKNLKPPSKEALEKWSWKESNPDTWDPKLYTNQLLETELSRVPPADVESNPSLIPVTPVPHASLVSSIPNQTSGFSTGSGKKLQAPSIAALKEMRFNELSNHKFTMANTPRASLFDVSSAFINSNYNASTPERFLIQKSRNVSLQSPTPNALANTKSTTPFGKRSGTLLKSVLTPHELRLKSTPFKAPNLSKFRSPLSNSKHQQAMAKNRFFEDQNHESRKSLSDLNLRELSSSTTPYNDEIARINCETAENFVFIEAGTHYTTSKYRQNLIQEGCKSDYLSDKWINNHYSLIIWKAAAMTKRFIDVECWNHKYVLQQLLYRYDCEVNLAKRSFFKLLVEGDCAVNGHVVLCVSRVSIPETGPTSLELTDGWYFVKAELDKPLENLLKSGKIYPGQKLHIQGCKLTGISGPCPILDSPPTLRLSISFNATRVAKRFEILGYRKAFFPVCIRSVVEEGGTVNCLDCTITRIFPAVYFEKLADGKTIARSTQVEDEAFQEWQCRYELEYEKILAQYQQDPQQFEFQALDADSIREELKTIVYNRVPPRIVSSCVTMEICDNPPNGCLPFECSYSLVSFYGSSGEDLENFKEGSSYRIFNLQVSKGSDKYRIKFKSQKNTKYFSIPTNTEERFILPRNFCRASKLKRSDINHTIDFVGIILSVLSQSSGEQYVYHLLCCDESMEKVIIKVTSLREKDTFFKPWEPMIFLNLQRMYSCKRYHKLNASIYSEFQKAPKPPFQKTRRLNELSAFMKQHKELQLSKDDYAELLKEVSLGCPEQIIGDQHESRCACSIMPFESMITVGNVHFFGNKDEAHLFTSETGFIFNLQIKDSTEYVSFGESEIKDLLKELISPTQLTDICTNFQQSNDDENFISKRERVFQLAELNAELDKLVFVLQNGKISTSIEKTTLFPFSQREWSNFISDLSSGISNKLFSVQTQEGETSRFLYATKIHPL